MPLHQQNIQYTYKDYLTWPDNERWELISGIPYMQAAPAWQHHAVSRELFRQISNYLIDKNCQVFAAPL